MKALFEAKESRRGKNQCSHCLWFDKWENLEPFHMPAQYGMPAMDVYVHRGATGARDYYTGELTECKAFQIANPIRRARPRCPKCGHGGPEGHHGKRCIGWMVSYSSYDGESDAYECGCDYDARKEQVAVSA